MCKCWHAEPIHWDPCPAAIDRTVAAHPVSRTTLPWSPRNVLARMRTSIIVQCAHHNLPDLPGVHTDEGRSLNWTDALQK
jgi:hypothetical protein